VFIRAARGPERFVSRLLSSQAGNCEVKCRAVTNFRVYPNPTAIAFNDSLTNRQPHSCTGEFPTRVMKALEEGKYLCLVLRFYADPIVGDREVPLPVVLAC